MNFLKSPLDFLSFAAILIGFFFMGAAFFDNVTFLGERNATIAVGWFLVALWCQREKRA